jgi:hypothetical protein
MMFICGGRTTRKGCDLEFGYNTVFALGRRNATENHDGVGQSQEHLSAY